MEEGNIIRKKEEKESIYQYGNYTVELCFDEQGPLMYELLEEFVSTKMHTLND